MPGYEGNGYTCYPEEQTQITTEVGGRIPQKCLLGVCWCPAGYTVDKYSPYCVPGEEITEYPTESSTADEGKQINGYGSLTESTPSILAKPF